MSYALRIADHEAQHLVRFTVDLSIDDGKLGAFESTAQTMTAGSQKEPGTLD